MAATLFQSNWVSPISALRTGNKHSRLASHFFRRLHSVSPSGEGCIVEDDSVDGNAIPDRWDLRPEEVKLLCKCRSRHNLIRVLEISRKADILLAGSRVLLLDKPGNIHSVQFMFKALTGSYYDAFATLPPLLPTGPVGILGLGAGTTARLLHHFWPELEMHGWELDPAVVGVGRKYFDMLELEQGKLSRLIDSDDGLQEPSGLINCGDDRTVEQNSRGRLVVHIGDALSREAVVDGGFAGLMVDLYAEGKVIPPLQDVGTWDMLRERLRPGGRIMVNCGGSCVEAEDKKDGNATMRETLAAIQEAFGGEVARRTFYPSDNCMAMTGAFPDIQAWKSKLPRSLRVGVSDWRPTS